MSNNLKLNVNGSITINAVRSHHNTINMGFVDFNSFAQFRIEENSVMTLNSGSQLNSVGYIYGDGTIEGLSGSVIKETLYIKSFRGGTASSGIVGSIFPFNQFTVNSIETKLSITMGTKYFGLYYARAASTDSTGEVKLIGNDNEYLLRIIDGQITKTYNNDTGQVNLSVDGEVKFNSIKMSITLLIFSTTFDSKNKDLPFDGTWSFKLLSGSKVTVSDGTWLGFLPGSNVEIEEGATLNIEQGGKVSLIPPGTIEDYTKYPNDYSAYYREDPNITFDTSSKVTSYNNGKIIVKEGGGLAFENEIKGDGLIIYENGSYKTHTYKAVIQNGTNTTRQDIIMNPLIDSQTTYKKGINNDKIARKLMFSADFYCIL